MGVKETGLYYLQSRYYNPETGRFLNADGLVSNGQGIIGNNMLTYCNNNPIMFIDSTGFCVEVGALLTWYDCGNHNCPTSSLRQPTRYAGGYNNPKNNYHIDSEPYWENLAKMQEVNVSSPLTFYNGVPVISVPGSSSFSFGIIFMGKEGGENLLRHEYGHTVQLQELGVFNYYKYVVKPSVYRYWKTVDGIYSWDSYYSTPWEYQADQYGGAVHKYQPWANESSERYWNMVNNLI